jgi:hypothetical protein
MFRQGEFVYHSHVNLAVWAAPRHKLRIVAVVKHTAIANQVEGGLGPLLLIRDLLKKVIVWWRFYQTGGGRQVLLSSLGRQASI